MEDRVKTRYRIGESRMQKCGRVATIIEYQNSQVISVRFEDGYIAKNKKYYDFCNGNIGNPNVVGSVSYRKTRFCSRVGENQKQKCGQVATVVAYRNYQDITVQFEDGTVVDKRSYDAFLKGRVGNPNAKGSQAHARTQGISRAGESRMQKCGQIATIIEYKNASNIAVKFEDGTVAYNKTYGSFKLGQIGNPELSGSQAYARTHRDDRIGESKIQKCGQVATIIKYRIYNDITVQFEDGSVVSGKSYQNFQNGQIRNPSVLK